MITQPDDQHAGGLSLAEPNNQIGALSGTNSGSGDIVVVCAGQHAGRAAEQHRTLGGRSSGGIDIAVSGNMLVGGDVSDHGSVTLLGAGQLLPERRDHRALGCFHRRLAVPARWPVGGDQRFADLPCTLSGSPTTCPAAPVVDTGTAQAVVDPVLTFIDLFTRARRWGSSPIRHPPPGDKDRKQLLADALVVEGGVPMNAHSMQRRTARSDRQFSGPRVLSHAQVAGEVEFARGVGGRTPTRAPASWARASPSRKVTC